jgi:hypothetical protein
LSEKENANIVFSAYLNNLRIWSRKLINFP